MSIILLGIGLAFLVYCLIPNNSKQQFLLDQDQKVAQTEQQVIITSLLSLNFKAKFKTKLKTSLEVLGGQAMVKTVIYLIAVTCCCVSQLA